MRVDQCRKGVVVCLARSAYGTILTGGYRPLVRFHATDRELRVEEDLLDFVAPDQISFERQRAEAETGIER